MINVIKPALTLKPFCWKYEAIDLNCKTRILWVMDGSINMNPNNGFALTEAKTIVEAAAGTNHPVEITTAHRTTGTGCDVAGFTFDGTHVVAGSNRTLNYYEEIWIFSVSSTSNALDVATELPALERFMQRGGGVFATGDHDDLGAGLCENIPRVKSMRKWRVANGAPRGGGVTRIDTSVPSPTFSPDFDLQSDALAQRIYPMWQGSFDAMNYLPHPVLEMPNGRAVTHLPDHPHEGKCVVPRVLDIAEYPKDNSGIQVKPEIIAHGVSGGAGFSASKPSITPPKMFGILGGYDGHQVNIGRVVVDSTWHHWLNINLNGKGAGSINSVSQNGLYDSANNPTPEYLEVQQYFQNIAAWLEPKRFRICFFFRLVCTRWNWPFIEEFDPVAKPSFDHFVELGAMLEQTLLSFKNQSGSLQLLQQILDVVDGQDRLKNTFNPLYHGKDKLFIPSLINSKMLVQLMLGGAFYGVMTELPDDAEEANEAINALFKKYEERSANPLFEAMASGVFQADRYLVRELRRVRRFSNSITKALV